MEEEYDGYGLLLAIKQRVDQIYLEQDQQRERLARIERLLTKTEDDEPFSDLPGLTVPEAAEMLSVSERTIFNYIKAGKLRNLKIKGRIVIAQESVEKLKQRKEKAGEQESKSDSVY